MPLLKHVDTRSALTGGVIAAAVVVLAGVVVGSVSQGEARGLVEAMTSTARFLCSSVMTASATTLALMLTVLSLSSKAEQQQERSISDTHYHRVRDIALADVCAFVGATVLLLLINVPLTEGSDTPPWLYEVFFYTLLVGSSLVGGAMISVILLIYKAATDIIAVFWNDETPDYLLAEEESERRDEEEKEARGDG
jgi:hypothetical protein